MGPQQFGTFGVAGQLFGIEVASVQEVIRQPAITPVPLAPREVRGLVNLRGQIVTVVDLRRRLGLPESAAARPLNVVLRGEHGLVSLVVDEIGDVLDVDHEALQPVPDSLDPAARRVIRAVCPLPSRVLLVLDAERVLDAEAGAAPPLPWAHRPDPSPIAPRP